MQLRGIRPDMRHLVALASLVAALVGAADSRPAYAVGETCNGVPATMVGTPGGTVTGSEGPDVIVTAGALRVSALGGDDLICTTGTAHVGTGPADVIVDGGPGNDLVDRRDDPDPAVLTFVMLSSGHDTFYGGPGADSVSAGDQDSDLIQTFGGNDYVDYPSSAHGSDVVDLGDGDDQLYAGTPLAGLDVAGGPGSDVVEMQLTKGHWALSASDGSLTRNGAPADHLTGFETWDLVGGRRSRLDFTGTPHGDELVVTPPSLLTSAEMRGGADSVNLHDSFYKPDSHLIVVNGGSGTDTLAYTGLVPRRTSIDLNRHRFRASDGAHGTATEFENAWGEGNTVMLRGNDRANVLSWTGCAGRGTVHGLGGADTIQFQEYEDSDDAATICPRPGLHAYGDAGDDLLLGGRRSDLLVGGPGHDAGDGGSRRDTCVSVEVRTSCEVRR